MIITDNDTLKNPLHVPNIYYELFDFYESDRYLEFQVLSQGVHLIKHLSNTVERQHQIRQLFIPLFEKGIILSKKQEDYIPILAEKGLIILTTLLKDYQDERRSLFEQHSDYEKIQEDIQHKLEMIKDFLVKYKKTPLSTLNLLFRRVPMKKDIYQYYQQQCYIHRKGLYDLPPEQDFKYTKQVVLKGCKIAYNHFIENVKQGEYDNLFYEAIIDFEKQVKDIMV